MRATRPAHNKSITQRENILAKRQSFFENKLYRNNDCFIMNMYFR